MAADDRAALDEQIAYYRARAPEYDDWFLRRGRYDLGEAHSRAWFDEVATVRDRLARACPGGSCLELACGTGLWTEQLARLCDTVTAVDASPEVLALNRERVGSSGVRYVEADLFSWTPPGTYDLVFFSFWLSHVPAARFTRFWSMVGKALRPGGLAFFVDNLADPAAAAPAGEAEARRLADGRSFSIVKIYYEPAALAGRLQQAGWSAEVGTSGRFFLVGEVRRGR